MDVTAIVQKYKNNKNKMVLVYIVSTILFVVGALYNGHISLGSNHLGKSTVLMYVIGLFGVISTLLTAIALTTLKGKIKHVLMYVGKNSFYYMAVHVPIKGFIIVILAKVVKTTSIAVSQNIALSFVSFVVTLVATTVTVHIINLMILFLKDNRGKK